MVTSPAGYLACMLHQDPRVRRMLYIYAFFARIDTCSIIFYSGTLTQNTT
jgi:hypothetical protein